MPTITINGVQLEFTPGEKILQVATRAHAEGEDTHIPYYCYHDGLSIPAQCRICLVEVWAPNPRNENKLEPMMGGKLQPACSTDASDGWVVYAGSPRAVANQKAVMEYLLINHPLDCPVCDQAGECELQDYSFKFGRGVSRFEESKVKQPKKDLGPHVYIYSDRCIMCTRCVRFAREVPETAELMIDGRGNQSQIDVFPGVALDNELSANVIDLCPVGALLDKDFLFAQRVWFLKGTPSIDGTTASGDNITIEHNEGKIYRFKPRTNLAINKWWITDEVRYGWKFIHSADRIQTPLRRQYGTLVETDWARAADQALTGLRERSVDRGTRLGLVVSPMLTCEEAYSLATLARSIDEHAILAVGPVPFRGEDKHFPPSIDRNDPKAYKTYAEKAPNARGVRRVLEAVTGSTPIEFDVFRSNNLSECGALILTANYHFPSQWAAEGLTDELRDVYVTLIDTLESVLTGVADVVLPGATWTEKAGTFENASNLLQAFEQAIPTQHESKSEGQIAADLHAMLEGQTFSRPKTTAADAVIDEGPGQVPAGADVAAMPRAAIFNAANTRQEMAKAYPSLGVFLTDVSMPKADAKAKPDVELIEL
ncbi:MAG: molybdopterin-dependent oxidoreductase [Planctomycetota bacterium]